MSETEKKHPRRIRWAARGALAGLVVLAVIYLRCGGGLGFGGGGGDVLGVSSRDEVSAPPPRTLTGEEGKDAGDGSGGDGGDRDARPLRCQLRLDGAGLWQLGPTGQAKVDVASAVASCKVTGGADVVITGDARQGAWDELRAALDASGVPAFVRGGAAGAGGGAAPAERGGSEGSAGSATQ